MSEHYVDPYEVAAGRGLVVRVPGPHEIQLDIDEPNQLDAYRKMGQLLAQNGIILDETKRTVSPGGNMHIYAKVSTGREVLTSTERIALQALLGSDPKREMLSLIHELKQQPGPPTVLFENPTEEQVAA